MQNATSIAAAFVFSIAAFGQQSGGPAGDEGDTMGRSDAGQKVLAHRRLHGEAVGRREQARQRQHQQEEISQLIQEHGADRLSRAKWLVKHPEILKRLADNHHFMSQHPHLLERLAKHRVLTKQYPILARHLAHRSLRSHAAQGEAGPSADRRDRVRDAVIERRDTRRGLLTIGAPS